MAEAEHKTNELMRAYAKALRTVKKENLLRTAKSAGFVPDPAAPETWGKRKGKRTGYQVFVLLVKYSDEQLAKDPLSGGLLERL